MGCALNWYPSGYSIFISLLRLATLGHERELNLHLREHAALHHLLKRHASWHLDCLLG